MNNKVALITGASAGIGKATALKFAQNGYRIVICDIDDEGLERVSEELQKLNTDYIAVRCDISKAAEVKNLINDIIDKFERLDVACNNAGIEGKAALTADYTPEEWDRVVGVNLRGQWLCMKYEIPHMLDNGGVIINMASILGKVGFYQAPAYTTAKHGLVGLTKAAALDYAEKKIRINAVCPGFIETPMLERADIKGNPEVEESIIALHPLGRLGKAEEVADAVYWLASDDASFVTGHSLMVDGGYVAR